MPKIILTRGIQGSGKSTWAKKWVEEAPEHRVRWNNDDFRRMLGKYWVPQREGMVATMKEMFFKEAMLREYDIVVDNMNLNPKEEAYFRAIIDKFNSSNLLDYTYELEFKDFLDITPEECIERDAKREGSNRIGKDVIMETYNRYKDRINELKHDNNSNKWFTWYFA